MKKDVVEYIKEVRSTIVSDGGTPPKVLVRPGNDNSWITKKWAFIETGPGGKRALVLDSVVLESDDAEKMTAAKIIAGHELCHASFEGMYSGPAVYKNKQTVDENALRLSIHMLIESACDYYGNKLYIDKYGAIPSGVLEHLETAHGANGSSTVLGALKSGYLTPASRITLIPFDDTKPTVSKLLTKYCDLWETNSLGIIDRVKLFDALRNHTKKAVLDKFLDFDI